MASPALIKTKNISITKERNFKQTIMTSETKEIKVTDTYKPDPRTFGGIIKEYDFEGYTSMTGVADKIFSDWRFDNTCRRISQFTQKCR